MSEARDKNVQLPQDRSSHPIQTLGHSSSEFAGVTLSGASQQVAIPAGAEIIEIAALADCNIVIGTNAATATTSSPAFPKGVAVYKVLDGQTTVAAILATGASSAVFTVTRLK